MRPVAVHVGDDPAHVVEVILVMLVLPFLQELNNVRPDLCLIDSPPSGAQPTCKPTLHCNDCRSN